MKIRFLRDFDWTPPENERVQIAYRADGGPSGDGVYGKVRRECGAAAVAAGAGEDVTFNGANPDDFDHDGVDGPGGSKPATETDGPDGPA